ncbi:MAG: ATP synthase F1 subunit gamma [Flavobacteriales bacterium]|nr:ATP synthase F1 subunit gamma [Flavobacteriales bacterium]
MANLKEIRNRIASVSSTMQITSAMKMVSAAKLKKATDAITEMRPYSNKLTELIQKLTKTNQEFESNSFTEVREIKKELLIAITSNRGLCGGFNSNVIKAIHEMTDSTKVKTSVISIGKKGSDLLSKKFSMHSLHDDIFDNLNFESVSKIVDLILNEFDEGKYDSVKIIYNRFKNAATQIVTTESFLPILTNKEKNISESSTDSLDYIYEPSQKQIIDQLLPKALKIQLLKSIKDSIASEHGARMTAMHKATDNAQELRDQLKLSYNKARQASITNEILEIVGGAEALKN